MAHVSIEAQAQEQAHAHTHAHTLPQRIQQQTAAYHTITKIQQQTAAQQHHLHNNSYSINSSENTAPTAQRVQQHSKHNSTASVDPWYSTTHCRCAAVLM